MEWKFELTEIRHEFADRDSDREGHGMQSMDSRTELNWATAVMGVATTDAKAALGSRVRWLFVVQTISCPLSAALPELAWRFL